MPGALLLPADAESVFASADLSDDDIAALPATILDAQAACEGYCEQGLALNSYTEAHRPSRTRQVRLKNQNVVRITRVAAGFQTVFGIVCSDNSAQRATAEIFGGQLLLTPYGATVATSAALTLSSYTTLGQLAAAVNAVPGWQALVTSAYSPWLVADLILQQGTMSAKPIAYEIPAYVLDLDLYNLKSPELGHVELIINYPDAYRFPDRTWGDAYNWTAGADPRTANVFFAYQAGFDAGASGGSTVPGDLRRAMIIVVAAMLGLVEDGGLYKSETVKDWSATRVEDAQAIPPAARRLLYRYKRKYV